ncbi:MAG: hypothetical protein ACJAZO_000663 [Myxococcota bacterium]|jgi:hypothetical protein
MWRFTVAFSLVLAACSTSDGTDQEGPDVEPVADTERPLDPAFTASGPAEGTWYRYDWSDAARFECHEGRLPLEPDCLGRNTIWTPSYIIRQVDSAAQTFTIELDDCQRPMQLDCRYELDGNYECGPAEQVQALRDRYTFLATDVVIRTTFELSGDFRPQVVSFEQLSVDVDTPMAETATNSLDLEQVCEPQADCDALVDLDGQFPCSTGFRDRLVFTQSPDEVRAPDF